MKNNSQKSTGNNELQPLIGFPEIISVIESDSSAEILMVALGQNLKKLVRQCPSGYFSPTTVYMITI